MPKRTSRKAAPARPPVERAADPRATRTPPPRGAHPEAATGDDASTNDRWPYFFVLAGVLFNAWALRGELTAVTSQNDHAFHLLMVKEASAALARGGNPLDFWIPQLELGFPQFLYYQHLPHLLLAALHRLLGGSVSAESLLNFARYLLLVLMPVTVTWSMRRMGYSRVAAAVGGMCSTLIAATNRFGLEYNSYTWQGFGMYAQLAGVHCFFAGLGALTRLLREGRGMALTAVLMAALALSHLVLSLMFAVAAVVILPVGATEVPWRHRALRLLIAGSIATALASYMLVPFVESSRAYLSNMPWLEQSSRPGRPGRTLALLVDGSLLDEGRLPVLTLLTLAGVVLCAWRRQATHRIALAGLIVMTGIYVVRPGSGAIGDLLPAKSGFVTFRFIAAVGAFAVLTMSVAAEELVIAIRRATGRFSSRRLIAVATAAAAIVLLTLPAVFERARYYAENGRLIAGAAAAANAGNVTAAVAYAASRPGRVYAGTRIGWGCEMAVGEALCVTDRLQAQQLRVIGNPLQSLALSSGLVANIPDDSAFVYDMFDIRTVLRPIGAPVPSFYTPRVRYGTIGVYATPGSGIAQYAAVTERRRTDSQRELFNGHLEWIRRGSPQRHEVIRWDYHRPAGLLEPRVYCPGGGTFANESFESQQMAVRATCPAAAGPLALVFKSMYHPQWRVWVDGKVAEPYMVSPGYLAVDVASGTHDVVARYIPDGRKLPLLVFGLSVLAAAVVFRRRLEQVVGAAVG